MPKEKSPTPAEHVWSLLSTHMGLWQRVNTRKRRDRSVSDRDAVPQPVVVDVEWAFEEFHTYAGERLRREITHADEDAATHYGACRSAADDNHIPVNCDFYSAVLDSCVLPCIAQHSEGLEEDLRHQALQYFTRCPGGEADVAVAAMNAHMRELHLEFDRLKGEWRARTEMDARKSDRATESAERWSSEQQPITAIPDAVTSVIASTSEVGDRGLPDPTIAAAASIDVPTLVLPIKSKAASAAKPSKKSSRSARRSKAIGAISASGVRAAEYCKAMDERGVRPARGWREEGWPGTYVDAWNSPTEAAQLKWRDRISKEKTRHTSK